MTEHADSVDFNELALDLQEQGLTIVRIKAEYSIDLRDRTCGYWLRRLEGESGQMTAAFGAQCRALTRFPKNVHEMCDHIIMLLEDYVPTF